MIPLRVRTRFGQLMPFAFISLKARRVRPRPFLALVYTGSPWTTITPYDSMMSNIQSSALKKDTEYPEIAFAGYKFWRLLLRNVGLRIKDETGGVITFDMPSVSVLMPTKKVPYEEFRGIPSVLGCDFVTINKLYLHFDPSKNIAFLEKS